MLKGYNVKSSQIDTYFGKMSIVPMGICEQHQDHPAMIHDTASVSEIAKRVASHFHPHIVVEPTVSIY